MQVGERGRPPGIKGSTGGGCGYVRGRGLGLGR
jgi:hypothetical protein